MWLVVRVSVSTLITSEGKCSVVSLKSLTRKSQSARSRHLLKLACSSLYSSIEYRAAAFLLAICYNFKKYEVLKISYKAYQGHTQYISTQYARHTVYLCMFLYAVHIMEGSHLVPILIPLFFKEKSFYKFHINLTGKTFFSYNYCKNLARFFSLKNTGFRKQTSGRSDYGISIKF